MKELIKRIAVRLWPELDSKTYFPILGKVIAVPDPPFNGEDYSPARPRYAVDVRVLTPDGAIDEAMPLLRDVPVAMAGAANARGFAALPLPGTVVEIAFAFGRQSLPFVRSVLPDGLALPETDGVAQRWQHAASSYQEVDRAGNWTRSTDKNISDRAAGNIAIHADGEVEIASHTNISVTSDVDVNTLALCNIRQTAILAFEAVAAKIWIGTETENLFTVISNFMSATISALTILAGHTHGGATPDQAEDIKNQNQEATSAKTQLDLVKK